MKKSLLFCCTLISLTVHASFAHAQNTARLPQLLIRLDDIGMNHSVNMALQKMAETGFPISASVQFACPWYREAAVPSLVDTAGYFYQSTEAFAKNGHPLTSKHRQTELNRLLSPEFKRMIDKKFHLENDQQMLSTKDVTVLKAVDGA
jgi:hypothetical protein